METKHKRLPNNASGQPDPYNICCTRGDTKPSRTTQGTLQEEYDARRAKILSKARYRKVV